jgi:arylsulfatase
VPANASGVIYALGGFSGGLALYVKDGVLSYEYNLFEIQRTHIKAKGKLPTGKAKIEVETIYVERKPAGPLKVVLKVDGKEVASGQVPVSAPLGFTANDALDFGIDLGSPVGIEYYDQAPFKFNGTIEGAQVKYLGSADAAPPLQRRARHAKRECPWASPTAESASSIPCTSEGNFT